MLIVIICKTNESLQNVRKAIVTANTQLLLDRERGNISNLWNKLIINYAIKIFDIAIVIVKYF